jgi:hypothetical protein
VVEKGIKGKWEKRQCMKSTPEAWMSNSSMKRAQFFGLQKEKMKVRQLLREIKQ